jgi:hypothetical protein
LVVPLGLGLGLLAAPLELPGVLLDPLEVPGVLGVLLDPPALLGLLPMPELEPLAPCSFF